MTVSRETLDALATRHGLPAGAAERFERLLEALEAEPDPPTTVRGGVDAVDRHLADSLIGRFGGMFRQPQIQCLDATLDICDAAARNS